MMCYVTQSLPVPLCMESDRTRRTSSCYCETAFKEHLDSLVVSNGQKPPYCNSTFRQGTFPLCRAEVNQTLRSREIWRCVSNEIWEWILLRSNVPGCPVHSSQTAGFPTERSSWVLFSACASHPKKLHLQEKWLDPQSKEHDGGTFRRNKVNQRAKAVLKPRSVCVWLY